MRVPSRELNELIGSLSGNEKSYFKKFASKNISRQKNYLELFDIYTRPNVPTDENLRKKGYLKHLSRAKNYLYEVILKILRIYHSDFYIQSHINEYIQNAEILHEKLLFDQALKAVEKAKALSKEYEMLNNLLDSLWWERHITMRMQRSSYELMRELERITEEMDHTLLLQNNLQDYRKLSDQLYIFINHIGTPRSKDDLDKMEQHMSSPLLRDETLAISYWAKLYFYQAHHLYADTIHDFENSHIAAINTLQLMESRPKIANEHMYGLLHTLNYVLISCIETGKYDLFNHYLKKLRELPRIYPNASTRKAQLSIFETGHNAEITKVIKTGDFELAVKIIDTIMPELTKYTKDLHTASQLVLSLNISKAYFGTGNYKSALVWLNKVLQNNELTLGENLVAFTRIFNLIIHLELKNDEVLPYIVKSVQRALLKKNRLYRVENAILNFVKKYSRMNTQSEMMSSFAELKNELKLLQEDPYEKIAFEEFNYIDWLESRIQGRKLGEVAKERLKKETERIGK